MNRSISPHFVCSMVPVEARDTILDARRLKAFLAAEIIKTLDKKELSVRKAQTLTGIDADDFSRIRNADFRRMTVERFITIVNRLGSRIEFKMRLRPVAGAGLQNYVRSVVR